jgi:hypothetical protein
MLLGLAMEYAEVLNRNESVVVMHAFQKVAETETERYLEKYSEEAIHQL